MLHSIISTLYMHLIGQGVAHAIQEGTSRQLITIGTWPNTLATRPLQCQGRVMIPFLYYIVFNIIAIIGQLRRGQQLDDQGVRGVAPFRRRGLKPARKALSTYKTIFHNYSLHY